MSIESNPPPLTPPSSTTKVTAQINGAPIDQPTLPETLPRSVSTTDSSKSSALVVLGSLPCSEKDELNGELKQAAACASACAMVEVVQSPRLSIAPLKSALKSVKPPQIFLDDDDEQAAAQKTKSVHISQSPPAKNGSESRKLSINVAKSDMKELTTYLEKNQEKRYVYKILYAVQALESHSQCKTLSLDELCDLKKRLNLLSTIQPYRTQQEEPKNPSPMPWPPMLKIAPQGTFRIPSQIATHYYNTYANILTSLENKLLEAQKSKNPPLETAVISMLNNEQLFDFRELLVYSVVTDHLELLKTAVPLMNKRILEEFDNMLDYDVTKPIQFMMNHGGRAIKQVYPLVENLLALFELEKPITLTESTKALEVYLKNGGDVLRRNGHVLDLVNLYAQSPKRNPEVLELICSKAEEQLKGLIQTLDVVNPQKLGQTIEQLYNFADARKLPPVFAQSIMTMIEDLRARCLTVQVSIQDEPLDLLNRAEGYCLKHLEQEKK